MTPPRKTLDDKLATIATNGDVPHDPDHDGFMNAVMAEADHDTEPAANPDQPVSDPSFEPVDLGPVLAGKYAQPIPTVLHRDDGQAMFYLGEVNGIHGQSGEGKGWVVNYTAAEQLRRGNTVMIIDLEDNAPSIVARMRLLGASDADLGPDNFVYVRPAHSFGILEVHRLAELVEHHKPSLVVFDSLGEAFALDGIDENADVEVAPWLRKVARRLAELGPAVVLVDHSTKANDNPLFPSGSKRKRAAITGASYLVTAPRPLAADTGGRLRLTCAKDRHGTYHRGETAADIVITTGPLGLSVAVYAPDHPTGTDDPILEIAVTAAVKAAAAQGGPASQRVLVVAMSNLKASAEVKRAGIDVAVARGLLIERPGPKRARLFELAPTSASECVGSASDALAETTEVSASVRPGLSGTHTTHSWTDPDLEDNQRELSDAHDDTLRSDS